MNKITRILPIFCFSVTALMSCNKTKQITISFDGNGGNVVFANEETNTINVDINSKWSTIKDKAIAKKNFHTFKYWTLEKDVDKAIDDDYTFNDNATVYAFYTSKAIKPVGLKMYDPSTGNVVEIPGQTMNLNFFGDDIPYVTVNDEFNGNPNFNIENNAKSLKVTVTTDTVKGSKDASFTYNKETKDIVFSNYDGFISGAMPYSSNPLDASQTKSQEGIYFAYDDTKPSEYKKGDDIKINLDKDYSIPTYSDNENVYLPLYCFSDFVLPLQTAFYYAGGNYCYAFTGRKQGIADVLSIVMAEEQKEFKPSQNYLNYCFNELCVQLDMRYGIKGVTRNLRAGTGSKKFLDGGAKEALKNYKADYTKDIASQDATLRKIFKEVLDDGGHTALLANSLYDNSESLKDHIGPETLNTYSSLDNMTASPLRQKYNFDWIVKKDATVFITLDGFVQNEATKLEDKLEPSQITSDTYKQMDTYAKVHYFNRYLRQSENSDVKHVVFNFAGNGGGHNIACEFFTYWVTRGNRYTEYRSGISNATSRNYTKVDVNLDNKYDEKDYMPDNIKTVDFLCSNSTFSCGNLAAAICVKYSDPNIKTRIIGETAGGGTCSVDPILFTPTGASFQLSGKYVLSLFDNNKMIDVENINTVSQDAEAGLKGFTSHGQMSTDEKINEDHAKFYNYDELASIINARKD